MVSVQSWTNVQQYWGNAQRAQFFHCFFHWIITKFLTLSTHPILFFPIALIVGILCSSHSPLPPPPAVGDCSLGCGRFVHVAAFLVKSIPVLWKEVPVCFKVQHLGCRLWLGTQLGVEMLVLGAVKMERRFQQLDSWHSLSCIPYVQLCMRCSPWLSSR